MNLNRLASIFGVSLVEVTPIQREEIENRVLEFIRDEQDQQARRMKQTAERARIALRTAIVGPRFAWNDYYVVSCHVCGKQTSGPEKCIITNRRQSPEFCGPDCAESWHLAFPEQPL